MKIFISWSGELSQLVALSLRTWIENVIQVAQPYVSSEDMEKGTRWFTEVDNALGACGFGVICLTRENMNRPWILFEAGAMSRSINQRRVTPLLIDLTPADLSGPLSHFQATTILEEDMLRLVKDIGKEIGDSHFTETLIERTFRKWWPDLQKEVTSIVESIKPNEKKTQLRQDREILEEVLQTNRTLIQLISSSTNLVIPPAANVEAQFTTSDAGTILTRIKAELEKRRKMMIVTALDKAKNAYIDGALLYIEFEASDARIKQELEQPLKFDVLREICHQVTGRAMGIRVQIREAAE